MGGFEIKIPDKVRKELLAKGWDGETLIPPDGEQTTLEVGSAVPSPDSADADLDALFGPAP